MPQPSSGCVFEAYVCPACKAVIEVRETALQCRGCSRTYPIVDGIVDFVGHDMATSGGLASRFGINRLLNLVGGVGGTTLAELVGEIAAMVQPVEGRVLDAACGSGTYGRRVACERREVFGVDVSIDALRQGVANAARDGMDRMHFARAMVETLPFADACFDAAICCGALHLFPDTSVALVEIARALKPRATLAAMTFTPGRRGLLGRVRRLLARGVRLFEIDEMEAYLQAAGFENFRPMTFGSMMVLRASKRDRA